MRPALESPAPRRRRFYASAFVLLGVSWNVLLLVLLVTQGQVWNNDFGAYLVAARRVIDGVSPYTTEQVAGVYLATDRTLYLYPPLFAQLLGPVTLLPPWLAKALWLVASFGAAYLATWIAAGIGGVRRGPERNLWCLALVLLFPSVFLAAWLGNVSTIISLATVLVALGGTVAGLAAALALLLKVAPAALAPAVLVQGSRSRRAFLVIVVAGVLMGVALSPDDWRDYPAVLLNMVDGGVGDALNFAPHHVASRLGLGSVGSDALRLLAVAGGLLLIGGSMAVARRPGGMPMAALLGTVAMLLIPGTLWYHYLAVLLPFAAMAWPQATQVGRAALVAGAILAATGLLRDGLVTALVGTAVLFGAAGVTLWRMSAAAGPYYQAHDRTRTTGDAATGP